MDATSAWIRSALEPMASDDEKKYSLPDMAALQKAIEPMQRLQRDIERAAGPLSQVINQMQGATAAASIARIQADKLLEMGIVTRTNPLTQIIDDRMKIMRAFEARGAFSPELVRRISEMSQIGHAVNAVKHTMAAQQLTEMNERLAAWGRRYAATGILTAAKLHERNIALLRTHEGLFQTAAWAKSIVGSSLLGRDPVMGRALSRRLKSVGRAYDALTVSYAELDAEDEELPATQLVEVAVEEIELTARSIILFEEPELVHDAHEIDVLTPFEESEVFDLLGRLSGELQEAYAGALAAYHKQDRDYARHVIVSLRALWENVIRRLAPVDAVNRWLSAMDPGHVVKDKVNRRDKWRYMMRHLHNRPMEAFFASDGEAFDQFCHVLNAVHREDTGISARQLHFLITQTETRLRNVLLFTLEE